MGRWYDAVKGMALVHLPAPILARVKRWHYARSLRAFRDADEPDIAFVRSRVGPGMTVLDLGANIGVYTRVLSEQVGPGGNVISVEPMPETFGILASNIRALGLKNVRAVHAAISDHIGIVHMTVPSYEAGGSNYYMAHITDEGGSEVPCLTLDELLGATPRVSFVKCDVEGHELVALRAASRLLEHDRPAWLIEVSGNPDTPGSQAAQVFSVFEAHGYAAHVVGKDGTLRSRRRGEISTNYVFEH